MRLIRRADQEEVQATIVRAIDEDFERINSSGQFVFDWRLEMHNDVFKLILQESDANILGLISVENLIDEKRIHINLLEISKSNRGHDRQYEKIAGCLFAFSARLSILLGYNGFVTLEAKNDKLSEHYHTKYGFIAETILMYISFEEAQALIKKYIDDEK